MTTESDLRYMQRALELARRGQGSVEPNPMVGCVLVNNDEIIGEGWHETFGGPHAEVNAITAAKAPTPGSTAYVTLEPCCHHGKTPPCTDALISAGIGRVVVAMRDPFPRVDGGGLQQLVKAGIDVATGLCNAKAELVNLPYLKLVQKKKPWIIAKWAMTLDGKLATSTGDSQWISNASCRAIVHEIRGRVDGIMVGRGTAQTDNPRLTARPAGRRTATRIVLDPGATLSCEGQLAQTARDEPVLVFSHTSSSAAHRQTLNDLGCEVHLCEEESRAPFLEEVLLELGRRNMTNVLVEGGAMLFGTLCDARQIDEIHAFIAPKIVGGETAPSPIGGIGIQQMANSMHLIDPVIRSVEDNVYISGRVARATVGA